MDPKVIKFRKYSFTYFNKEEISILIDEIFKKEIYSIHLQNNSPTIFDIGSYIGLSTIYFKDLYPKAKIRCFEPNPNIFPILEENIFLNNLKDVTLHNIALGKNNETRSFYIDKSANAAFSTASFRKDAWNGKQRSKEIFVKTKKLSEYIDNHIDLIKIDIEGAEKEVLDDLENSGKTKFISNMLIEYHPKKNTSIKNIVDLLRRNSFDLEFRREGEEIEIPEEKLILIIAKKRTKES